MKQLMDKDFLLSIEFVRMLYHDFAERTPILDYHCHINPQKIAGDRKFDNITRIWLGGDHYKWRQMRSNGVEEKYTTGDASDREKFQKQTEILPKLIDNPLYYWSYLELQKYLGYTEYLNGGTAEEVWNLCNAKLQEDSMSVRNIIRQLSATLTCTTDDLVDSLEWYERVAADITLDVQVLFTWRSNKTMNVEKPTFAAYMVQLSGVSGVKVTDFASLKEALKNRMAYFAENGYYVPDHALEYVMHVPATDTEVDAVTTKGLVGQLVSREEELQYKTAFMLFVVREYNRMGWIMQLHYGCKQDNNAFMFGKLGADTGFDCTNNYAPPAQMVDSLNTLSVDNEVPKTIIHSLNPNDNASIGTIIGYFQNTTAVGKIQQGSAWWFNGHKVGMTEQMTSLANLGCLGNFVGMLIDPRDFLSYTRYEYFRKIMRELIGGRVENGEYPADTKALKEIVEGISYNSAVKYLGLNL